MPNFSYRALGRDGKEVRGVLQAENETAAAARIRDNYPVLLSISKQAEKRKAVNLLEMEIGSKKIKTKTLSILCSQFAITLRSGMSVSRAMQMLAGQCGDKRLRKIMEEAGQEVSAGSTVAAALEQYSERFPLTFIETIRAGEQSGTLDKSFDRLHKFYDKAYKTTEKVKGALTYPMFVIAIAIVVVIIVMAKVIPTLADVFSDLGGQLPLMTRMLIDTSDFFAKWWILILAVLVLLKVVSSIYAKTETGKIQKAKLALSIPLVGPVNQMNAAAQFANTMSVLLAAGITLDQAIETTAKVMDNALFQYEVRSMKDSIEQGRTLSDCLRSKKYFPQTMIDMCSVGEETGELEETLENVADYYTNEADYRVQRLLAMLEPTLLVLLSIFAGIIVVSIYLPIFTMYDLM
ncbi:type II secretion system F family protein [Clostridium sp. OM02-18AC]|uniref:type II secretion system F family protein n=1 Tax=Clostridium sp. OM02-18AC TaxID=2292311 RepID=UPI000E4E5BBE|nr:type II secretion system F family protein [Clostridium sp. OM02-18AC]RHV66281.1 type II secretion system F family protein [Clostridium sp. OM02-18AC]